MMYELRILSGLHRGATLPLDDIPLTIGASETDDVVLVDPGVEDRHATLSRSDSGWLLSAEAGQLSGMDSDQAQKLIDLTPGERACIGHVWISIEVEGAPWQEAPAASERAHFDAAASDPLHDAVSIVPLAENPTVLDRPEAGPGKARHAGIKGMLYASVAMVAVICAAAAYAINVKPSGVAVQKRVDAAAILDGVGAAKRASKDLAPDDPAAMAADLAKSLSQAELQTALRRRLSRADLLSRFDLTLNNESWELRANLDDEETARFERVLTSFIKEYHITFPVNAKVVGAENMLPFKIRQVISGNNASVVTQDGERLYVGDEAHGIRLMSIQDTHLVFAGKRKIEVNW